MLQHRYNIYAYRQTKQAQDDPMFSSWAVVTMSNTPQGKIHRARNWNSAGMRIRPPRSPEPSASGASKWAGVDDGRLPSLSQMQMFMAATILEGGCREASGRIHMNSAGGHENSATGYIVAERPLFELSTA